MTEVTTTQAQQTKDLGHQLASDIINSRPRPNNNKAIIVCLHGDLGGGKTTFTKGFALGLGISQEITSPTFVIMKRYPLTNSSLKDQSKIQQLIHCDLYRITKSWELQDLNFDELLQDKQTILLIEWAENAGNLIPSDAIHVNFTFINANTRYITIQP